MESNGKRKYHLCTKPGFFEQPKWLSNGRGTSVGAEYCPRCLRALMRLYGMAGVTKRGGGIYTTASREIVTDEERFNANYNNL